MPTYRWIQSVQQLVASPVQRFSQSGRRSSLRRIGRGVGRVEALEVRQVLTGDFEWVQTVGAAENQSVQHLATDAAGNLYQGGYFHGSADFDPGTGTTVLTSLSSPQGSQVNGFITKSSSQGNLIWAGGFLGTGSAIVRAVAVGSDGTMVATGSFSGSIDFDPGTGVAQRTAPTGNGSDIFVAKLTSAGALTWVRTFGDINSDSGTEIAVDQNSNVYVGGSFRGTIDFDPGTGNTATDSGSDTSGYVLKLNSSGGFQWVKHGYDSVGSSVQGLSVRSNRVGVVSQTTSMGGAERLIVNSYDRLTGELVYHRQFDGTGSLEIGGIELEDDGSSIIAGNLGGSNNFSANTPSYSMPMDQFVVTTPVSGTAAFLARLNPAGGVELARTMPGKHMQVSGLTRSASGDIYIAGMIRQSTDADPGTGTASIGSGTWDAFVSAYTGNGEFLWAKATTSDAVPSDNSSVGDVVVLPDGKIVIGGSFSGTVNFDPDGSTSRTSVGGTDMFLWTLSPDLHFDFGATLSGNVLLKRNLDRLELWFNESFTFGQYVLMKSAFINGTRSVRISDNSFSNSVTLDFQAGGGFGIRDGIHFGSIGNNDVINLIGNGNEGITFAPRATIGQTGQISAYGGHVSFAPIPSLNVSNFQHLYVEPLGSIDAVTVAPVSAVQKSLITGTTNGTAFSSLTFDTVRDLTIDTGKYDGVVAQSDDGVTFNSGSLEAAGLKNVYVRTGKGNDALTVNGPDIGLPVDDGKFWYLGGAGSDRLATIGDANWDLNDLRVVSGTGGRILFDDIEKASMTGGASKNHLNASLFSGDVTLDGSANDDILRGGSGSDLINGGLGNDRMFGGFGDDTLQGQDGNDQIWGDEGDDTLRGGNHNDQLFGGEDNDFLAGDGGNDFLDAGRGNDALVGGGGIDLYQLQGTENAEDLQLIRASSTNAQYRRKPRGLTSLLELDSITMDAIDEFLITSLDGDDFISVDLLFTQLGSVDGGNGTDSCTAPAAWTKVSC